MQSFDEASTETSSNCCDVCSQADSIELLDHQENITIVLNALKDLGGYGERKVHANSNVHM